MKVLIISGSHKKNSESQRIGSYLQGRFQGLSLAEAEVLSLADNPLPLWDEGVWAGDEKWTALWSPISKRLEEADAYVVIAPEWSGMVPAALKNFFLLCSAKEVGYKPALIVAVSSGIGGAYPVAELRTSSYKNTRLCYIPEHVIVRNCTEVLKGAEPQSERDANLRARLDYSAKLLSAYAKAHREVRESGIIDLQSFPYGD